MDTYETTDGGTKGAGTEKEFTNVRHRRRINHELTRRNTNGHEQKIH